MDASSTARSRPGSTLGGCALGRAGASVGVWPWRADLGHVVQARRELGPRPPRLGARAVRAVGAVYRVRDDPALRLRARPHAGPRAAHPAVGSGPRSPRLHPRHRPERGAVHAAGVLLGAQLAAAEPAGQRRPGGPARLRALADGGDPPDDERGPHALGDRPRHQHARRRPGRWARRAVGHPPRRLGARRRRPPPAPSARLARAAGPAGHRGVHAPGALYPHARCGRATGSGALAPRSPLRDAPGGGLGALDGAVRGPRLRPRPRAPGAPAQRRRDALGLGAR